MEKTVQFSVLALSLLIALFIFGREGNSFTFTQAYVGFVALIVAFADIVSLYGEKD